MPIARIEEHNGSPAIMINGVAYPPMMATIRTNRITSVDVDRNYYRELGKSGIKIFFLICDTEWLKPGAYELFCEEAQILLEEVPDAYIMLRIGMHPPVSWCDANPDETLTYSDGLKKSAHLFSESYVKTYSSGIYSFASAKWQKEAGEAMCDVYRRLAASPYADRIAGIFFAAGGTSEWYYITPTEYTEKTTYTDGGGFDNVDDDIHYNGAYADLSPAFRSYFSRFLRAKYKTDEALRRAWHDDTVTIDAPRIPDCDARYVIYGVDYDLKHPASTLSNAGQPDMPSNGTNIGSFLDMDRRRDVFDFFRAWHEATADAVIYFGSIAKSLSRDLLTGAFYGSAGSTKFFGFSQVGAVDKILRSGVVDFLASPGVYENRHPGGFTGQRQNFDSFRLKNTIFVVEDDTRTHFETTSNRALFSMYDMHDTEAVLKREFGRNICQDTQAWWFDQLIGGGRYKHPDIYALFAKQSEIAKLAYSLDRRKRSEIALIYDEESYHVIGEESSQQMVEIFRNYDADIVGAPMDRFLHNDMSDPAMPDYKLYIFANALYLTDEEREVIRRKLAKNHATALFMYGAGVINVDRETSFSANHIADLTGIQTVRLDGVYNAKFRVCGEHPIAKGLKDDVYYGDFDRYMMHNASGYIGRVRETRDMLLPLLYADDPDAETIAYFADSGMPALSVKDVGAFTSIYCGAKYVSAEVVRSIAAFAGCHIFCDTDDVLYANPNFITFHAATGGEKVIRLPERADVFELYENKLYAKGEMEIRFSIKRGETKMFRVIR